MNKEIERKYLVDKTKFLAYYFEESPNQLFERDLIQQGYFPMQDDKQTLRIRLSELNGNSITLKHEESNTDALIRQEYELPIEDGDEEDMFNLTTHQIIKERVSFSYMGMNWAVDIFRGFNEGLVLGEVEFSSVEMSKTLTDLPDWFISDVTNLPKYQNFNLARYPYRGWEDIERE